MRDEEPGMKRDAGRPHTSPSKFPSPTLGAVLSLLWRVFVAPSERDFATSRRDDADDEGLEDFDLGESTFLEDREDDLEGAALLEDREAPARPRSSRDELLLPLSPRLSFPALSDLSGREECAESARWDVLREAGSVERREEPPPRAETVFDARVRGRTAPSSERREDTSGEDSAKPPLRRVEPFPFRDDDRDVGRCAMSE